MPLLGVLRVLVVLAGDPVDDTVPAAVEQGLRSSLGADAVVAVRQRADEGEAALARDAASENATLLCIVTWTEHERSAALRFFRPAEREWGTREIRFGPGDVAIERGRTVGFAVASMVPDEALAEGRAEPEREPPERPVVIAPLAHAEPTTERAPNGQPSRHPRHAIEMAGHGAIALGGSGGGIGGTVAARLAFASTLRLRLSIGGRMAHLDAAQATARTYFGGLGLAWSPGWARTTRWEVGGRVDALLLGQHVVHFSSDDPEPAHRFRVLPAVAATAEGAWRFAGQAAVVLGLGLETALGRTDVFVRDQKVVSLVPVRPFAEAGMRVYF